VYLSVWQDISRTPRAIYQIFVHVAYVRASGMLMIGHIAIGGKQVTVLHSAGEV